VKQKQEEKRRPIIYTLGTSNRSLEEFCEILQKFGIEQVIDVRSFPQSRRFPHFTRKNLEKALLLRGVAYIWLGKELGGYRKEGYQNYMKTENFREGMQKLLALSSGKRSVILCAERFPWRCHRRFIAQRLEELGCELRHILDGEKVWIPRPPRPRPKFMF